MLHVEEELARIERRLAAYPDPFEHAGLYTAQQALRWALDPNGFASPYWTVTRCRAGASKGCSEGSRHLPSSENTAESVDAA
jgi:hypothetical protein